MINNYLTEIQQQLSEVSRKESADFFRKMVPGKQRIYGVKTPVLNELVKKYKSGSFELAEQLWESGALEEKIIAIKIMEKTGATQPERLLRLFKQFSRNIDNWAVCDGLGMQFLRGIIKKDAPSIFRIANKFNLSRDPWKRRLSLVMVEWYTRDKNRHPEIIMLVRNLEQDHEYYVKKAVIWIRNNLKKGK